MSPTFSTYSLLALALLPAAAARGARDPFLPIDYKPPAPIVEKTQAPEPAPPAPTPVKPVTADDWAAARKTVKINGVTKSVTPSTGATVVQAMVNGRVYAVGDTVTLVHEEVRFQWRVTAITDQDAVLTPLAAERLPAADTDLKGNQ